jgi:hypothetical protein
LLNQLATSFFSTLESNAFLPGGQSSFDVEPCVDSFNCGTCRQLWTDLASFLDHKNTACAPAPNTATVVIDEDILETSKSDVFSTEMPTNVINENASLFSDVAVENVNLEDEEIDVANGGNDGLGCTSGFDSQVFLWFF